MDILLKIINNPEEKISKKNFKFSKKGGTIGRSHDCSWVLADSKKIISNYHIEISYFDGSYFMCDISTNGTFYKLKNKRVPPQEIIKLDESAVLIIGEYEILINFIDSKKEDYNISDFLNKREIDVSLDDNRMLRNNHSSPLNVILKETAVEQNILTYVDVIPIDEDPFFNEIVLSNDALTEHINTPNFIEYDIEEKIFEPKISLLDDDALLSIFSEKLNIDFENIDRDEQIVIISKLADTIFVAIKEINNTYANIHNLKKKLKINSKLSEVPKDMSSIIKQDITLSNELSNIFCHIAEFNNIQYNIIKEIDKELSKEFSPKNLYEEFDINTNENWFISLNKISFKTEYSKKYAYLNENSKDENLLTHDIILNTYQKIIDTSNLTEKDKK